jgi:opacity protein-like surface antigen
MSRHPLRAAAALAAFLTTAAPALHGQAPSDSGWVRPLPAVPTTQNAMPLTRGGEPRFAFGGGFSVAQPVHEFRQFVTSGYGGSGFVLWRVDPMGALALRLEGGGLNYGRERQQVGMFTGRIRGDLTTTNNIGWGSIGPQLMVPVGPIRPYAHASVGFSYFVTSTSLRRRDTGETVIADRNYDDATIAWGGGGGVLLPVARGFAFDLGARYHRNGDVEYLRRGGIVDLPDGSVQYNVTRSRADLWTWHLGAVVGIGRVLPGAR